MKALLVAAVLLGSALGYADEPSPREEYERGIAHYNLSEWNEALEDFKAAYRQSRDAAFLFNIGQCLRQLKRYEEASLEYRAYLRENPNIATNIANQVKALIGQMDDAARMRATSKPAASTPAPTASQSLALTQAPLPMKHWYHSAAGWSCTALGVTFAAVGAGLVAHSAAIDVSDATSLAGQERLRNDIAAYSTSGWVTVGIGTALVATGIVLFAVSHKKSKGLLTQVETHTRTFGGFAW